VGFPSKTTAYSTLAVELLALNSDFYKKGSDNPQDDQYAWCRWYGKLSQSLVPHACWSLNWLLFFFPGQDDNHRLPFIHLGEE